MTNRQSARSDETKKEIINAAEQLFSQKGFDAVTIREIAKLAGCSHTTIYLYYKDKEALLYKLSMPHLNDLYIQMEQTLQQMNFSVEEKLKIISKKYIYFCLQNKSMYSIFFNEMSSRVDEEPVTEINKLRLSIFNLLKTAVTNCLQIKSEQQILAYSRIFYFNLNGILSTYSYQHEPLEVLMERLIPTFDLAVEIMLEGMKGKCIGGEKIED
ncbi:TetR/AcrR family transcriptional regulator [Psychrobacillus sp. Sa2BUA9]|uniref:TetR/AcrR family transcriptional regulator n=1 Tax=Psychrobacillus faecigallinarum TaxID=2762235 RepID=A0ABR8RA25_9BACI|nr:TetR/AcrR family transcriptional regulator [Psychrobacillus faecigallinarum]MBD7944655.1 TetR/AcrR family transcriptional regulator [Psychrobacillus faecigallinarum]